jgi:hypothetical protein
MLNICLTINLFKQVSPGAEPSPQVGGVKLKKKSFEGPKLKKIIKFGAKF